MVATLFVDVVVACKTAESVAVVEFAEVVGTTPAVPFVDAGDEDDDDDDDEDDEDDIEDGGDGVSVNGSFTQLPLPVTPVVSSKSSPV